VLEEHGDEFDAFFVAGPLAAQIRHIHRVFTLMLVRLDADYLSSPKSVGLATGGSGFGTDYNRGRGGAGRFYGSSLSMRIRRFLIYRGIALRKRVWHTRDHWLSLPTD
jgi:hypothetical protein